ncbi:MAG: HAD-IA family hydrolase [Rhodobacter sp.]|nr:HAD-IA family hydrolase [Rhodobacter sp.]
MTLPALVLFDCDGVLVDSEPITNALLQEDLATRGLSLSFDQIDRLFTGGTMRGVGEQARAMGADIPDDWVEGFYVKMHARLAQGTPAIDGIENVLDRLDAAQIPYAVGSNGSLEKMAITLGQHPRLQERLKDRLYSAHTLGVAKPDPGLYLAAARDMGVAPQRTAVIDDSPSGCRAAQRAGMRCFGYAAHGDGARLAAEGAQVFHAMADLPTLLQI